MGVPVVTRAGKAHVSRVGVSLMENGGVAELIAFSRDEYVEKAVALAGDLPRLQELRSGLRNRLQSSALMNVAQFTRNLEQAYLEMVDQRST